MRHSPVPVFAKSGTEIHRIPHKKKTITEELFPQSSVFEKTIWQQDQIFAMMSGMLDLSKKENAKHFSPRWLSDAPTWISVLLSIIRKRSWKMLPM